MSRMNLLPGAIAAGAVDARKFSDEILSRPINLCTWNYQSDSLRYLIPTGGPATLAGSWAHLDPYPLPGATRQYRVVAANLYTPVGGVTASSTSVRIITDSAVVLAAGAPAVVGTAEVLNMVGSWNASTALDALEGGGTTYLYCSSDWVGAIGTYHLYYVALQMRYKRL